MSRRLPLPSIVLCLAVVVFTIAAELYAFTVPPFEVPDETAHMSVIAYIRHEWRLQPMVVGARVETGPDWARFLSYHEPPLYYTPPVYYWLGAAIAAPASRMDDLDRLIVPNPRYALGWALVPDANPAEKNVFAHRFGEEAQSSTISVLYALRGLSIVMGIATLLVLCWGAELLWPEASWLPVVVVIVAVATPQFVATCAAVTNDSLMNLLFALSFAVGLAARRRPSLCRWMGLGLLAGLGLLTKQSGLMLLPMGVLMAIWREADWRTRMRDGAAFLSVALAVGGWWYVRNGLLYGDPTGLSTHFIHANLPQFPNLAGLLDTFYAQFGWALLRVEEPVYWVVRLVVLVGLAGVAWSLRRKGTFWSLAKEQRRELAIFAVMLGLNLALLVSWSMRTGPSLGRLLYPSLMPIACLLAWGWSQWAPWKMAPTMTALLVILAILFVLLVPAWYLRPAFGSPLVAHVPETACPICVEWEHGISLVAYEAQPAIGSHLRPGDTVHLRLYWRADREPIKDYFTWVQLGPDSGFPPLVKVHTWAGTTLYPTGLWRAGDIIRQDFVLTVPKEPEVRGRMWLRAGFVDGEHRVTALHSSEGAWDGAQQAAIMGPFYVE